MPHFVNKGVSTFSIRLALACIASVSLRNARIRLTNSRRHQSLLLMPPRESLFEGFRVFANDLLSSPSKFNPRAKESRCGCVQFVAREFHRCVLEFDAEKESHWHRQPPETRA